MGWVSDEQKMRTDFDKLKANARRMSFENSPAFPHDEIELANVLAAIKEEKAAELSQLATTLEADLLARKNPSTHNLPIIDSFGRVASKRIPVFFASTTFSIQMADNMAPPTNAEAAGSASDGENSVPIGEQQDAVGHAGPTTHQSRGLKIDATLRANHHENSDLDMNINSPGNLSDDPDNLVDRILITPATRLGDNLTASLRELMTERPRANTNSTRDSHATATSTLAALNSSPAQSVRTNLTALSTPTRVGLDDVDNENKNFPQSPSAIFVMNKKTSTMPPGATSIQPNAAGNNEPTESTPAVSLRSLTYRYAEGLQRFSTLFERQAPIPSWTSALHFSPITSVADPKPELTGDHHKFVFDSDVIQPIQGAFSDIKVHSNSFGSVQLDGTKDENVERTLAELVATSMPDSSIRRTATYVSPKYEPMPNPIRHEQFPSLHQESSFLDAQEQAEKAHVYPSTLTTWGSTANLARYFPQPSKPLLVHACPHAAVILTTRSPRQNMFALGGLRELANRAAIRRCKTSRFAKFFKDGSFASSSLSTASPSPSVAPSNVKVWHIDTDLDAGCAWWPSVMELRAAANAPDWKGMPSRELPVPLEPVVN